MDKCKDCQKYGEDYEYNADGVLIWRCPRCIYNIIEGENKE